MLFARGGGCMSLQTEIDIKHIIQSLVIYNSGGLGAGACSPVL